jgi:hypothetical protein
MSLMSRWRGDQSQAISREHAAALARKACRDRGLTWVEPTLVTEHHATWVFCTNAATRGHNLVVVVSKDTGRVSSIKTR